MSNKVIVTTGQKLDVYSAMHDFEWAIIKSVMNNFTPKIHKGCEFHWLQAIRRQMLKNYNLEVEFADDAIHLFKFMTILEQEREIMLKAVEYIREKCLGWTKIKTGKKERAAKINAFFDSYFKPTWLANTKDGKKLLSFWNYHGSDEEMESM